MSLDVIDLRRFYASALGESVRRAVAAQIQRRWENIAGASILGLGFATPYLDTMRFDAMRSLAFMPASMGVVHWPGRGEPSSTALIEDVALPLPSGCIDRALLVHMLETSEHPLDLLREVWRVLEPGGRVLIVAPSRSGWWSRSENTPFGYGQPFSRSQLTLLLRETLFNPLNWSQALYLPPLLQRSLISSSPLWERLGAMVSLPFAGVHVVEATKQVYSPIPVRAARRLAAQLKPALTQGADTARRDAPPAAEAPDKA